MIELRNVWKIYGRGEAAFPALRGVSLKVRKGEYVSVMGPSGSGKSTMLHIMGLLDSPTKGEVLFSGRKVSRLPEDEKARMRGSEIGFVFQQFNLIPRLTALENVMLPMWFQGTPEDEMRERAAHLLELVGLKGKEHNKPSELSGGQQQRVAIARALANSPSVILADEPTGNLDTKSGMAVMDLLESLHEEGRTLVVITHDPSIGGRAERTVKIIDGKIVEVVE